MLKRPDIPLPPDPSRKPVASYSAPVAPSRQPPPVQKTVTVPGKNRLNDPMVEPGEESLSAAGLDHVTSGTTSRERQGRAGQDSGSKVGSQVGNDEGGEEDKPSGFGLFNFGGEKHKHGGQKHEGEAKISLAAMFAIGDDERESEVIIGVGDRARHLAMANGHGVPDAPRTHIGKTPILNKSRPASRGDCERRCGSDGFCDPSSPNGCGGSFCLDMS